MISSDGDKVCLSRGIYIHVDKASVKSSQKSVSRSGARSLEPTAKHKHSCRQELKTQDRPSCDRASVLLGSHLSVCMRSFFEGPGLDCSGP